MNITSGLKDPIGYAQIGIDKCKEICIGECNRYAAEAAINNWLFLPFLACFLIGLCSVGIYQRERVHALLHSYLPAYPDHNIDKLIGWMGILALILMSVFIIIVLSKIKITEIAGI